MKLRHLFWMAVLAIMQTSCQDIYPELGSPIQKTPVFAIKSSTQFNPSLNIVGFSVYKEKPLQISYVTDLTLKKYDLEDYALNTESNNVDIKYSISDYEGKMYYTVVGENKTDSLVMPNVDRMDYEIKLAYNDEANPEKSEGTLKIQSYSDSVIFFPFERYLYNSNGVVIGVEYGDPDTLVSDTQFTYLIEDTILASDEEVFN
ncbi:hypothetical protein [Flammeovirga pacifica]|uniref:Uncharacterized protein n=1 Tax=Flammeovirga pacifica TaxID=915059 RepID=A0A1S1YS69_FLAPC|nr:hypothetical protein [Flammeovirga pacifica]OHX63874.1 hypothetical protein NH26_19880 [Flammeovirga pacifica]